MLIIYSDKIILEDKIIKGYIKIKDSIIESITNSINPNEEKYVVDLSSNFIAPGIININSTKLDTNNLFRLDKQQLINNMKNIEYNDALNGVTTLYHGVYLNGHDQQRQISRQQNMEVLNAIKSYNNLDFALIDNKMHLCFQLDSVSTIDEVKYFIDENLIDLISYDIRKNAKKTRVYTEQYMQSFIQYRLGLSEELADKMIERIRKLKEESNVDELSYLIKYAHWKNIKVTTTQYNFAVKISEQFKDTTDLIQIEDNILPIQVNKNLYYKILKISDLTSNMYYDSLDEKTILTSIASPNNLISAYCLLAEKLDKPKISTLISKNPAIALGLENIGMIKEGYKADIIAFKEFGKENIVTTLIKNGNIKFQLNI